MVVAVYPGTFDPLTRGHEDLVRRASGLFDRLVVGVADSKNKKPFFSLDERLEIANEVLGHYPNVQVESFSGLLKDFVRKHDARVIVLAHEILQQAGKTFNLHVRIMAQHFVGDFQALVEREEGLLVLAVGYADHQAVEQARCTAHQVLMATRERIESTWINGYNHCGSLGESPCKNAHYA